MSRTKVKKRAVCAKCGTDERENTAFCYNCGSPVSEVPVKTQTGSKEINSEVDDETQAALVNLAKSLTIDAEADGKLAKAAAQRKRSRVELRKSKEFSWEPTENSSGGFIVLFAVLIAVIATGIVLLTVYWK